MRHSVSCAVPAGTGIAEETPIACFPRAMSIHVWRRRNMKASASSAHASAHARHRVLASVVEGVDDLVIRVTDRAPSTRVLWMVLGASLVILLLLALMPAKRGGSSDAFIDAQQ